jgi:rod shape-determining protein MreD
MHPNKSGSLLAVLVSLLVAMGLRILPGPHDWSLYNPDWVLLFLVYWNMALPARFGVGAAWLTGLFTDALTGRMLGQYALAYTVVAFLGVKWHRQLRHYPLSQQALSVLGFSLISQLLVLWTQNFRGSNAIGLNYWLPSLVGALCWPVVFIVLRYVRRTFGIA